ncbi:hypothetical protein [Stenotrophomonas sepilia]
MTPEQFAYWMQGFAELNGAAPTQEQWDSIREHLKTVFHKVTPPVVGANQFPPLQAGRAFPLGGVVKC